VATLAEAVIETLRLGLDHGADECAGKIPALAAARYSAMAM